MKKTIKAVLLFLSWLVPACYAVDCYGGSIEYVKDCIALGGCSWLSSNDGLGSVHTKARSYRCKDGSEYMLVCSKTQVSNFFGSGHEQYAACSDVSKKEYLVKVGAEQTKFNPAEEKIDKRDRQKAKAHANEMQRKADDYLQKQLQIMKKGQWKNNREKYVGKYGGSFVDKRDGRKYRTIQIGDQNWMAENLRYEYKINGKKQGENCDGKNKNFCDKYGTIYKSMDIVFDEAGALYKDNNACYHKNEDFCPHDTSEGLVMQGICPDGWRLPTRADWKKLKEFVGADSAARVLGASGDVWFAVDTMHIKDTTRYTLKYYTEYEWKTYKVYYGTDNFGFSVYPDDHFELLGKGGISSFWIADYKEVSKIDAWTGSAWAGYSPYFARFAKQGYEDFYFNVINLNGPVKSGGAVRCIQNDEESTRIITERRKKINEMERNRDQYIKENGGSFVDERDGNEYKTIRIGNMNWMAENLRYYRFCKSHGKDVECSSDGKNNVGKMGYEYSKSLAKVISSNDGSVCPAGWRLPSSVEWSDLFAITGNDPVNLMSSENASDRYRYLNEYGFSLLMQKGKVWGIKPVFYWTGDEPDFVGLSAKAIAMDYKSISPNQMFEESFAPSKRYVRCVEGKTDYEISRDRDSEFVLKNGGSFVDPRDGQKYRAVRIGNQIWMGDNLNFNNNGVVARNSGGSVRCLNKEEGCRYQWPAAQKACPVGWRLPKKGDFATLFESEENKEDVAKKLNVKVLESGNESEKGVYYGVFWSSTEEKPSWVLDLIYNPSKAVYVANFNKYGYDEGSGKYHYDSIQAREQDHSFPVRCIAKSETKSGIIWNRNKLQNSVATKGMEKKKDKIKDKKNRKPRKVKHGIHAAYMIGYPLLSGKEYSRLVDVIQFEMGYQISIYWLVFGAYLGDIYMDFYQRSPLVVYSEDNDNMEYMANYYLGIPFFVRYPFTESFYMSGGVVYKHLLNDLGTPPRSEYIAMSENQFRFSLGGGMVLFNHLDIGALLSMEYLDDEESQRDENYRNLLMHFGLFADFWF